MNISIKLNSVEIVNKVLSYTRTLDICSGIGTLELIAQYENDFSVDPWDVVEVYEDGDKVGEFYVSMFGKSHDSGEKQVSCQDGSKKLVDYFIDNSYSLTYPTTARYWIGKFLTDAKVTYSINATGSGGILSENSTLGTTSAYDAIQGLLQMSGWYMYFDPNGTCIVDTLTKDLSENLYTVYDSQILELEIKKSDKDLRNKAVVWGNYSGGSWAFATKQLKTGYETSEYDWRAVVLSNSTIYSSGTAASLAIKLLNEFANISVEKIVTLAGYHPVTIGDLLTVDSNYFSGTGLITNVQVVVDPGGGVKTILTLDVRCPRLFAYYGFITWVYTGTEGSGVWRKRLDSATWQDYSTGLNHYNVRDLMIKNSVFACIADGHCYVNLSHYVANWQMFDQGILADYLGQEFQNTDTEAVKVDIDDTNNWISIGYKLTDAASATLGEERAWTVIIDAKRNKKVTYPIVISTTNDINLELTDVEKYVGRDLVSVISAASPPPDPSLDSTWGYKRTHPLGIRDHESNLYSVADDTGATYTGDDIIAGPSFANNKDQDTIFYGRTSISFDTSNFKYTAWSGDTPFSIEVPIPATTLPAGGYSYLDLAVYWMNESDGGGTPRLDEDRHYVVTHLYRDSFPSDLRTTIKEYTPVLSGYPYRLPDVSCAADTQTALFGTYLIDGITPGVGDRVLVTNQTDGTENGVYIANMGAWARSLDVLDRCATIAVSSGTTYTKSTWQVATDDPIIDVTNIDIQRVLIPTTIQNNYQIAGGSTSGLLTTDGNITTVNGVEYFCYAMLSATTYPRTRTFYLFKYNCETGALSNVSHLSHTENYANLWANNWITVPCGTGIAQFMPERKLPKNGATVYDQILEDDRHFILYIFKFTASSSSTYSETISNDIVTSWWGDYTSCSLATALFAISSQFRYQGCRIVNGLYHPFIKLVIKYTGGTLIRDYDQDANCMPDCDTVDTSSINPSAEERLSVRVYDVYNQTLLVNEVTDKTYAYGVTGTAFNCDGIVVNAYSFTIFSNDLDMVEYNYPYGSEVVTPIYSKTSYPVFIIDSTDIFQGDTKSTQIGTLAHPNNVIAQTADDRGYLYIANPAGATIYREHHTGGTDCTFSLPTTPTIQNNFAYVNELFVFDDGYDSASWIKYNPSNSQIYKLSDSIITTFSGSANSYILQRNDTNTFDIIDTDDYPLNLEASVDWPLISRTYGEQLNTGTGTHHFRAFTTYPNYLEGSGLLMDARGWYTGGDIITFETGDVEIEYNKYGLILNSGGLAQIVDTRVLTDGNTRYPVYLISGTNLAIETSNHYFPNYIFISSENKFMQRNPLYNTTFLDHSSGMPTDYINIIRLDDRV